MNGLIRIDLPNGMYIRYSYDAALRLTSIETEFGTTLYGYDLMNRLVSVTDKDGEITTYTYDANGNRSALTYPNGNKTIYTYDTCNRLTSLVIRDLNGIVIEQYDYTLGAAGERLSVQETNRTIHYTYDNLYRLTQETIQDGALNLTFDYTYDDNGALIAVTGPDRSAEYTYNDLGRVSTATVTANGTTITESYLYDWAGTRTAKITDGVLTYYLVDTAGVLSQVLAELDHTSALITHYTHGSELISLSRASEKRFYLHDGQGSVRELSDTDGQVTDTYIYDAFGNLLSKTGTTANDFLYTGEQYDANTGFYYLRARYMNPSTGTFTSPDAYAGTIFDPVSLHKYLYANANPVMNRDPSGYLTLTEMETAVAIQAIVGAALNSIPSGILRLVNGAPMDGNFWLTFIGDFALGATMGLAFGWLGFLATQYLLACCLLRSIFGTMGLGFTWNFIQDVSHGDWGRALLNAVGAITSFWGASTNFYRGGGLGNHGGGSSSGGVADDAAGAADDVANVVDDATNVASDTRTNHILYGDETGGGHLWPGQQGKSSFPQNWDANTVMKNISDIATDPTLTWTPGRVINGVQRYEVVGVRDGIAIKVITDANDIITAFPIG